MRCMDLSGEKEFRGAMSLMCCLMVARDAGWKIFASSSRVMRRVLDGGEGCDNGGIEDRSSDSGDRDRFADNEAGDEAFDAGGDCDERPWVCIGEGIWRLNSAILKVVVEKA